jgi:hypothetical protein
VLDCSVGYEALIAKIDAAIAEIRAKLGHAAGAPGKSAPKKHRMSEAGRRHIAAAQRKRWGVVRKSQEQGKSASQAKPAAPKKRRMSASVRKRIAAATRKRWAAYRKASGKKAKPVAKKGQRAADPAT